MDSFLFADGRHLGDTEDDDPWDRDSNSIEENEVTGGGEGVRGSRRNDEDLDETLIGESLLVNVPQSRAESPPPPPPPLMSKDMTASDDKGDSKGSVDATSPPPPPLFPDAKSENGPSAVSGGFKVEVISETKPCPGAKSASGKTPAKRPFLKKGSRNWDWAASAQKRKEKQRERAAEVASAPSFGKSQSREGILSDPKPRPNSLPEDSEGSGYQQYGRASASTAHYSSFPSDGEDQRYETSRNSTSFFDDALVKTPHQQQTSTSYSEIGMLHGDHDISSYSNMDLAGFGASSSSSPFSGMEHAKHAIHASEHHVKEELSDANASISWRKGAGLQNLMMQGRQGSDRDELWNFTRHQNNLGQNFNGRDPLSHYAMSSPSAACVGRDYDSADDEYHDNLNYAAGNVLELSVDGDGDSNAELHATSTYQQVPQSRLVQRMFRTLDPDVATHAVEEDPINTNKQATRQLEAKTQNHESKANAAFAAKLQEEMDRFRETNEELRISLQQLEIDRRELARERSDLEREKRQLGKESNEQMEQLRAEIRKERAHLQRERVALERQKQHVEVLRETVRVERKDRGQVDSLQATITRMRLNEKEKASKHKEALQSKRQRITDLEREVEQMQNALRFAEERRLDLWGQLTQAQDRLESSEADKAQLRGEISSLREALSAQAQIQQHQNVFEQTQRNQDILKMQNSSLHHVAEPVSEPVQEEPPYGKEDDPEKHNIRSSPNKLVDQAIQHKTHKHEQGLAAKHMDSKQQSLPEKSRRKMRVHSDGSRTITYPDGTLKEILTSGEQTITFPNGDIKKKIPHEGIEIYYFAVSDISQTTYPDGMVVCEFPDGQIERKLASGAQEVFYVDGTVKTIRPDSSEETLFPDGTRVEVSVDGTRRVTRPPALQSA